MAGMIEVVFGVWNHQGIVYQTAVKIFTQRGTLEELSATEMPKLWIRQTEYEYAYRIISTRQVAADISLLSYELKAYSSDCVDLLLWKQ